ncbi:hypothetical protein [Dactylosporangium sp. CA-092794]|uniref:hypothetical protein n=1 Tax=Dactylosporangium sp. CA-092794 TaxID=3239929 RepID=UPI003D8D9994
MRRNGTVLLLLGALALTGCSARAGTASVPARAGTEAVARWHPVADLAFTTPDAVPVTPGSPVTAGPSPAGAGSGTPSRSAAGRSPAPSGGTGEDLRDGLLGDADVPAGFVPVAIATSHNGKVSIGGGSFPGCPALEPMTTNETTSAAVTYAQGAIGPYFTDAIVRFPAGKAPEAMARLRSTAGSCQTFDQQLAGISVRFRLAAIQPPAGLGDDTIGLRMTGSTDVGLSVAADIIAIRRGDYVLWLNDTTVGSTPPGLAAGLAPAAAGRCARTLTSC